MDIDNDKVIGELEIKVSYQDYLKTVKYFMNVFDKIFIVMATIILLFLSMALMPPEPISLSDFIEVSIYVIGLLYLVIKLLDIFTRKIRYKYMVKYNLDKISYRLVFYDTYFIKISNEITKKIKYSNILKYKEIKHNIYLKIGKNDIIVINRDNINDEIVNKIKYKIGNKEDSKVNIDEFLVKDKEKKKYIEIMLIVLFILSIVSLPIGMFIVLKIIQDNQVFDFGFVKYMNSLYYVLPIPLLSIIVGIIYKNKGYNGDKNIVIGIIMSGIILLYGSFAILGNFNFDTDYQEIDEYRRIIPVTLPDKALEYSVIPWDSSYLENHITRTVRFYDDDKVEEMYQEIVMSDKWLTKKSISSSLNIFIPSSLTCYGNDVCYYSIYIEEMNSYNTLPGDSAKYHIYAMIYDPDLRKLQIEEYDYDYLK